jgi:hypothetical protein
VSTGQGNLGSLTLSKTERNGNEFTVLMCRLALVMAPPRRWTGIGLPFDALPATLTLGEQRAACEQLLGKLLDKSSFRQRLDDRDLVATVEARWAAWRTARHRYFSGSTAITVADREWVQNNGTVTHWSTMTT